MRDLLGKGWIDMMLERNLLSLSATIQSISSMDSGSIQEQLNHTGLDERETALIVNILRHNSAIRCAILFGSRAKGIEKLSSDIDLAIERIDDNLDIVRLALELNDLALPYRFDVLRLESIALQAKKVHIERVGIVLYQK
ncbi:nucleotidyltransferase domain-containing protein [Chlorobaculum sp. 24CR]|uniref:nucleotidyltransferase domain-containing protein n=1 Tax=Chlorobaculum sp. 24CR TaxID=2508878 RepID=UPI00100B8D77|nr:nucleotidyltransferase domain-containing protein [Chlorobaculum sp. 24CR]RXK87511.1 nucleotidyltransferase domain-containing protein [Chlorobaculum sp. 24CR]